MKIRENLATSRFVTVQHVAKQLLVEDKSVRRWLKAGKLRGYKLPGGDWRIDVEDLKSIIRAPDAKKPGDGDPNLGSENKVQALDAERI